MAWPSAATWVVLLLSAIASVYSKDELLNLDIPENHGTQQIYEAFKAEPKETHIEERVADLVAHTATEENRKELDPFTAQCVRDFSQPCPELWKKNGNLCEAPVSYKGDCKRSVDTTEFTVQQKMLFMEDCNVKWPCKSSADKSDLSFCNNADRNFLQPCPENFLRHKQDSGYVCVPNFAGYMGPCNSIVSFENYSKESKMLWAQTCGTNWPCMTVCPFLFDKCPMDWVQAPDGACEAPASYKGPCEKRIHFTYYTQEMKRKKCIECDIPFECTSECNKDYDKCPVLWKSEEDGYCSPHSGSLNCVGLLIDIYKQAGNPQSEAKGASFYFGSLSQASKKLFESQCNTVEFPCMENDDDINWNLNCPVGWTISSEDLRSCQPPIINDDDVCKSQVAFNNEEDKRAFASLCQINWSAPLSTLVSKPVEKKLENDGPITDLGHLHAIDTTSGISSNHTKTIEKKDQKSPEQRGPKEKTVHIKAANTSLVSPYIVMSGSHKHRRPYKGFLREMHLLPGST